MSINEISFYSDQRYKLVNFTDVFVQWQELFCLLNIAQQAVGDHPVLLPLFLFSISYASYKRQAENLNTQSLETQLVTYSGTVLIEESCSVRSESSCR